MAVVGGRYAEAYTGSSKTTDLGFSYSARGEVTDVYEATPHSSGYYHTSASYWANGLLNVLNLKNGGGTTSFIPQMTYGADGEGRVAYLTASTGQNPIPSASPVSYNVFSEPTGFTLGSGDSDSFGYDSNTGRMTGYNFSVNSQTVRGTLTWNANGTLGTLAITDPYNSANVQTCTYGTTNPSVAGYDDLARLANVTCKNGSTAVWIQNFSFDTFGNLSKTGNGGSAESFLPAYNPSTNRVTTVGGFSPGYDANGNLMSDPVQSYSWDADGNSIGAGSATVTFDALDRAVEKAVGTNYTEFVYSPMGGKLALMNGQTLSKGFVPLPAGGAAVYTSGPTLSYYRHSDWLGSSRFASTPSRGMYYDGASAPYGENYAETGTTDRNFTGQNQDTVSSGSYPLYDFLMREHHPVWGRWLSPDPSGLGAADAGNPQTWNRYAYVANDPLRFADPAGLDLVELCVQDERDEEMDPCYFFDSDFLLQMGFTLNYNDQGQITGATVSDTVIFVDASGNEIVVSPNTALSVSVVTDVQSITVSGNDNSHQGSTYTFMMTFSPSDGATGTQSPEPTPVMLPHPPNLDAVQKACYEHVKNDSGRFIKDFSALRAFTPPS